MNILNNASKEIYFKHANLCKTMANANRIYIVELLSEKEMNVGDIAEAIGNSLSTTSQQLRLLRDNNVLVTRKDGHTVYYSLKHPKLYKACQIIREVLLDDMKGDGEVAARLDADSNKE